jgi:hypothetical protein
MYLVNEKTVFVINKCSTSDSQNYEIKFVIYHTMMRNFLQLITLSLMKFWKFQIFVSE